MKCLCGCRQELPKGRQPGKPQRFVNREHKRSFWRRARHLGALYLLAKARLSEYDTTPTIALYHRITRTYRALIEQSANEE